MKWWALYTNLPVDVIVRLPHPRNGNGQGHETLLAPSPDEPTRKSEIECSNHHQSLSNLRPKRLSCSKMKWWVIYKNLPVDVIVRLPNPRSRDSQKHETLLARSNEKPTHNYDIQCSKNHPSRSTLSPKWLSRTKMKRCAIYTNLPVDFIVRLLYPRRGDSQNQEMLLARSAEKPTRNYDIERSNHHPSLSTPSPNGVNRSKIKWWAKYRSSPVDVILRLPHSWRGKSQGQETFLAPSANKQTRH